MHLYLQSPSMKDVEPGCSHLQGSIRMWSRRVVLTSSLRGSMTLLPLGIQLQFQVLPIICDMDVNVSLLSSCCWKLLIFLLSAEGIPASVRLLDR